MEAKHDKKTRANHNYPRGASRIEIKGKSTDVDYPMGGEEFKIKGKSTDIDYPRGAVRIIMVIIGL